MDNKDKFLPNFLTLVLHLLFIVNLAILFLAGTSRNLISIKNVKYYTDEINMLQILVDDIVDPKVLGKTFKDNGTINDAISFLSENNKIDKEIIKEVFLDERINNQIRYELSYKLQTNLYKKDYPKIEVDRINLINKIIDKQELRHSINFNSKMKNQIVTILKAYIENVSDLTILNEPNSKITHFFSIYTLIITIGMCYLIWFTLYQIKKDWKKPLNSLAIITIGFATFTLTYTLVQKGLIWGLQRFVDDYNYLANSISSAMFISMLNYSLLLFFIPLAWFIINKQEKKATYAKEAMEIVTNKIKAIPKKRKVSNFKNLAYNIKYQFQILLRSNFVTKFKNKVISIALIEIKLPNFRPIVSKLKKDYKKKKKINKQIRKKRKDQVEIIINNIENKIFGLFDNKTNRFKFKIKKLLLYLQNELKKNLLIKKIKNKLKIIFTSNIKLDKLKSRIFKF